MRNSTKFAPGTPCTGRRATGYYSGGGSVIASVDQGGLYWVRWRGINDRERIRSAPLARLCRPCNMKTCLPDSLHLEGFLKGQEDGVFLKGGIKKPACAGFGINLKTWGISRRDGFSSNRCKQKCPPKRQRPSAGDHAQTRFLGYAAASTWERSPASAWNWKQIS